MGADWLSSTLLKKGLRVAGIYSIHLYVFWGRADLLMTFTEVHQFCIDLKLALAPLSSSSIKLRHYLSMLIGGRILRYKI